MNSKSWAVGGLAVAAIGACLFFLVHKPMEPAEQLATNASEALGLRAGEEVAQLLGQKGRVAVVELELGSGQAPTAVAGLEMFRGALKKHGVTVVRSKALAGGLSALVMGGGISRNDYASLVEGTPAVDAVITFAGLPNMTPEELRQFQTNHPRLVVVDIFGVVKGPNLGALVADKTIAMALVPFNATEAEQHATEPKLFERYYRILRAGSK